LAVVDLEAKAGVTKEQSELLTDTVLNELRKAQAFQRVVASREIQTILGMETQRQLLNCASTSCTAELAGALGVDFVLTGSAGRVGSYTMLNLKLLQNRTGTLVASVSARRCAPDAGPLVPAVRPAVRQMLAEAGLAPADATTERLEEDCANPMAPLPPIAPVQPMHPASAVSSDATPLSRETGPTSGKDPHGTHWLPIALRVSAMGAWLSALPGPAVGVLGCLLALGAYGAFYVPAFQPGRHVTQLKALTGAGVALAGIPVIPVLALLSLGALLFGASFIY
jgi:TolB-like protein